MTSKPRMTDATPMDYGLTMHDAFDRVLRDVVALDIKPPTVQVSLTHVGDLDGQPFCVWVHANSQAEVDALADRYGLEPDDPETTGNYDRSGTVTLGGWPVEISAYAGREDAAEVNE